MKTIRRFPAILAILLSSIWAGDMPTGKDSPEGVACDAIQAYADCDSKGLLDTLVRPIFGKDGDVEYEKFKNKMAKDTDENKSNKDFVAPQIVKVFKARNFTKNGPGSMAYALFEMTGNMFVDLLVDAGDGNHQKVRYHVMQDKDKKWYFEPRPDLATALAIGLNEETPSKEILWEQKAAAKASSKTEPNGAAQPPPAPVQEGKPKVEAVRKAAESGDTHAMTQLGVRYQLGNEVQQDWMEAEKWYLKAANLGDGEAMAMLGTCYEYKFRLRIAKEEEAQGLTGPNLGNADKAEELVQAVEWFRKAASKGNSSGMFKLASCCDDGWGIAKNDAEAVKWYKNAVKAGSSAAMCNLGYRYWQGRGVEQDKPQAEKLWRKSASMGDEGGKMALTEMGLK